ncbi:helix-turn-helix domain-containing protein [Butyrivibrio sp. WCD3002]|uniref:helix-turn-helix domain-containing protein n=1 Tax=Butyrivibrio sp. WCD3002 TaxID=1280676 RepID=UPI00056702DD|nr:helix-turn-helix transcriptional regulator [Butyrivibrio sp. WCD3002]
MTSQAYLEKIQRKLKRYRIESAMTQEELASATGLSLRSIKRFENGNDISAGNLIKILIALDLADLVDNAIPDLDNRPSAYVDKQKNRTKQRAHKKTTKNTVEFKWGDEQ